MDYNPRGPSVHGISVARILSGLPFPSPGVFLTQGSNLYLLHGQVDSLPLSQLESKLIAIIDYLLCFILVILIDIILSIYKRGY